MTLASKRFPAFFKFNISYSMTPFRYRCDAVKYGPDFKESPTFGVNTSIDFLGTIKVGDPVYAIRK